MNWKMLSALAILSLFLAGCTEFPLGPLPGPFQAADDSQATTEGVEALVNANNQFAFDLYSEYKDSEENVFFSPWSIESALGMTYEGAKGQTAEEMQSVLHFPEDDTTRQSAFARLYNTINTPNQDYDLKTANALWAEQNYEFLPDFFETVESYYKGKVTNLDFKTQAEPSRQTINAWVEDQTNNRIKDLIPKGVITPLTRLVLTNAVYFKGTWLTQFDPEDTKEADFKVSPGKTVRAELMFLSGDDAELNYGETENLQILELPYEGEELSMLVILPEEGKTAEVENSLSTEKLNELKSGMRETEINVWLPKFTFETKYRMAEDLQKMGMPSAFQAGVADFSGMDGTRRLYISAVIHQAFVEVNEEGTEAAAATAVVVMETSMPLEPKVFRADHPFIFIIQERGTGAILFMGKVLDPTA